MTIEEKIEAYQRKHLFDLPPKFKVGDKVVIDKNIDVCFTEGLPDYEKYKGKFCVVYRTYKREDINYYNLYPDTKTTWLVYMKGKDEDDINIAFPEDILKPYELKEEYKFTGEERDLFDRPKFKVGDKVYFINGGNYVGIIKKVSGCKNWYKEHYPNEMYDERLCDDETYIYDIKRKMDNKLVGYFERQIKTKDLKEEYKYTGNERDLFSRPKFKVGDRVLTLGKRKGIIKKIWDCEEYWKEKENEPMIDTCKEEGKAWIYQVETNTGITSDYFEYGLKERI